MTTEAHGEPHLQADGGGHAEGGHGGHPPTTIREYVVIGFILTVITMIELWCSYNEPVLGSLLVPVLIFFSAVKFVVVVAMFMHLRFEEAILTRLFMFGIVLVTFVILALIGLFWNDATDAVGLGKHLISEPASSAPAAPAPAKH